MSNEWPKQDRASMCAFYGDPDNGDGAPDAQWEALNIIKVTPPYPMVLAWNPAQTVSAIRAHKKAATSLLNVLSQIRDHYGSQEAIEAARLHLFGGCYNFRLMRGGHNLSMHSWGAAIDLDPERNRFGLRWRPDAGMMPAAVVALFKAEGWTWGGDFNYPDAMHLQAAHL